MASDTPPLASTLSNGNTQYITVSGDASYIPGGNYNSTHINNFTAMTVPAFYSGVRFLSETLASFTSVVHQPDEGTLMSHPVSNLLNRNISNISIPYRTKQAWYYHTIVWGDGYLWVKRQGSKILGLYNLNPELTRPVVVGDEKFYVVDLAGRKVALANEDVLHLSLVGFDGIQGYPLVYLMQQSLEVSKATERHTVNTFRKGTMLRGAVEVPGAMNDKQIATMKESMRAFQGNEGQEALGMLILQAGAHLNNSTMPNDTAQLIETRRWSVIEIAQMLRVAPHILYELSHGKWNSVEQMGAEVVKYSLGPWIVQTEQEQTLKLLTSQEIAQGLTIRIQTASLTRADEKTLSTQVLAEVNGGLKTLNEGRAELGLPGVGDEGDKLRVPVSFPTAPNGGKGATTGTEPPPSESVQPKDEDKDQPDYSKTGFYSINGKKKGKAPELEAPKLAFDAHAIVSVLIDDAASRVEAKTEKAFENREGKDLTVWGNVFAEEQIKYLRTAFKPVIQTATALGIELDLEQVGQKYASAIRKRAANGTKETLHELVKSLIHGEASK